MIMRSPSRAHFSIWSSANTRLILCQILNCCTFPSVFVFAGTARDEYVIWIWSLTRSGLLSPPLSLQTLMTASPSHVKMEELASTRLIPSSAFACRATGETCVRKVRRGCTRWRIIWWLPSCARGIVMHCLFVWNETGLCSNMIHHYACTITAHLFVMSKEVQFALLWKWS